MKSANPISPMSPQAVVESYFLEHRAKLLDVAAFLDRLDRAAAVHGDASGHRDFRMQAFRLALDLLASDERCGDRARAILELLSDPTCEPVARAGSKGAAGAYCPPHAPSADASAGTPKREPQS